MGSCLAEAALALGHDVVIVTGPVQIQYPSSAKVMPVISTEEMLEISLQEFVNCDGVIGAAAPCDYRPLEVAKNKLKKTGDGLVLKLAETPDVLATLGQTKRANQWLVGFALETEDSRARALAKLKRKCCDLIIVNEASAIDSTHNAIEILAPSGEVVGNVVGSKKEVAARILAEIHRRFIQ